MSALVVTAQSTVFRSMFLRDGFVGPFELDVPRARFDRVAARIDEMLERGSPHPLYGRFSVRDWHLLDDELLSTLADGRIVDILSAILGPDLLLWRSKVFAKRPGEAELGWHQEWGAFNGEEIGNDRPALIPAAGHGDGPWNLTVWIALDDVEADMGPIRFAQGSHARRFPITMKPLMYSEFWHDPFLGVCGVEEIVTRANTNALVLDIETSHIFQHVDTSRLSLAEAKKIVLDALQTEVGAVTLDFNPADYEIVDMPMPCGSFVVFSERVMHGSSGNRSSRRRLAVNGRYTRSDTVVYPFREHGDRIDGSNIDITRHECILVAGEPRTSRNVIRRSGSR